MENSYETTRRVVKATGIRLHGKHYWHPHLVNYIGITVELRTNHDGIVIASLVEEDCLLQEPEPALIQSSSGKWLISPP